MILKYILCLVLNIQQYHIMRYTHYLIITIHSHCHVTIILPAIATIIVKWGFPLRSFYPLDHLSFPSLSISSSLTAYLYLSLFLLFSVVTFTCYFSLVCMPISNCNALSFFDLGHAPTRLLRVTCLIFSNIFSCIIFSDNSSSFIHQVLSLFFILKPGTAVYIQWIWL